MTENNQEAILSLCVRLKASRKSRCFKSPSSFAAHCGIHLPTYLNHEAGRSEARLHHAVLYTKALNVSLNWLVLGEGKPLDHLETHDIESEAFLAFMTYLQVKEKIDGMSR